MDQVPADDVQENQGDESQIIADQDQTLPEDADDRNMGGEGSSLTDGEPDEFALGEVDVKTQMDRMERQINHPGSDVGVPPDNTL